MRLLLGVSPAPRAQISERFDTHPPSVAVAVMIHAALKFEERTDYVIGVGPSESLGRDVVKVDECRDQEPMAAVREVDLRFLGPSL